MISAFIYTINRQPSYVGQTIASMLAGGMDPIRLHFLAGDHDTGHLAGRPNVLVPPRDPPATWTSDQKLTWNLVRALSAASLLPADALVLIGEDDVLYASGWMQHVLRLVQGIPEAGFVLSLYNPHDQSAFVEHADDAGIWPCLLRMRFSPDFYGSLALVMRAGTAGHIASFSDPSLMRMAAAPRPCPVGDALIRTWLEATGAPIYSTYPSLAEHLGGVSTCGRQHAGRRAWGFVP